MQRTLLSAGLSALINKILSLTSKSLLFRGVKENNPVIYNQGYVIKHRRVGGIQDGSRIAGCSVHLLTDMDWI